MLVVHHGPHLRSLADDWADRLRAPLADPFTPEVVSVPTAGVRDWLTRHLAVALGVTANVEMPFPGGFVAAALDLPDADDDPWDVDHLVWSVLAVLDSGVADAPGWAGAAVPGRSRQFTIARRVADLFDRYATNRPELIQQWERGAPGDGTVRTDVVAGGDDLLVGPLGADLEWQFHLWRAVRARIGTPSPAERLPELLAGVRAGAIEPRLPDRVAWFGMSSIAPARLAVLDALAQVRDVHAYVLHPSPAQWPNIVAQLPGRLVPRRRADAGAGAGDEGHPLLRSWGRAAAELAAVVQGLAAADPTRVTVVAEAVEPVAPTTPVTLLSRIQHDLVADRAPVNDPELMADGSIQIHACHGTTRQLEVLRDTLAHLFVADPHLRPSDVLVLCPDLERFQPSAAAVFARGTLPVPLAVTDLSLGTENPVAAALVEIVRVVTGRCTALDVLGVAGLDPVRQRLGLSVADLDLIAGWVGDLGTSWGLDADQRTAWLGTALASGTWDATVQSLLLGVAMPAPAPRIGLGGIVPYDDMGADATRTAGRLAELIARLRRVAALLAVPRSMGEWCDVLVEVLGWLCAADARAPWQMTAVTEAIEATRVAAAGTDVVLDASDLSAALVGMVTARRGRLRLRSGHVTLTGLVPVRNVPATVICLLGFDEASLRAATIDGDDLLAVRPCVGEPDRRLERRQLVLDALLAAERHLVITCDGRDVTTNQPLPFAVQLAELLEVVDVTRGGEPGAGPGGLHGGVVARHPLRSYDDTVFAAVGDGPFGFDDAMYRAALTRRAADEAPAGSGGLVERWSLGGADSARRRPGPDTVTLAQLSDACSRPARTLLRDGLDVRLPGEAEELDPLIPIGVTRLAAASTGRRLLDQLRDAARLVPAAGAGWPEVRAEVIGRWRETEALSGRMPPGELARRALDEIEIEVGQLVALASGAISDGDEVVVLGAPHSLAIDIELAPAVVRGASPADASLDRRLRLVDHVGSVALDGDGGGSVICRLDYTRPKNRLVLAAALDLAAVIVQSGRVDWRVLSVTRGKGRSDPLGGHLLTPAQPDPASAVAAARRLLEAAAGLRVEALGRAIPLFEKSSRGLYDTGFLDEDDFLVVGFARGDLDDADTAFVWESIPLAEILGLDPTPEAYAQHLWGAVEGLAVVEAVDPKAKQGARR